MTPLFSIIIPVQTNTEVEMAQRCLESILRSHYKIGINIELILVNYGKMDLISTIEEKIIFNNKVLLRLNGGNIVQAFNKGIKKSTGYVVYLMENDVYFTQPSLLILLDVMKQSGLDIASPSVLYPNHVFERAGVIYYKPVATEPGWMTPRLRLYPYPIFGEILFTGTIVAEKCVAISRNAISRVGLLDEHLNLLYSGSDYCLRARQIGFKHGVVGYTSIIYDPGSTEDETYEYDPDFIDDQEATEEKYRLAFYRRWHGVPIGLDSGDKLII